MTPSGRPSPPRGEAWDSRGRGGLTSAEAAIWAGQRLDPGKSLYNMSLAFHIDEAVDPALLEQAFEEVGAGSDSLRTVFEFDGHRTVAVVRARTDLRFEVMELEEDPGSEDLNTVLGRIAARPFATDRALSALTLIQRPGDQSTIVLTQHHLVTDAWSMVLLFRRLGSAYRGLAAGTPVEDSFPSFSDRRTREHRLKTTPEWERARRFWAEGTPAAGTRRQAYGRAAAGTGKAERRPVTIPEPLGDRMRALLNVAPFKGLSEEQSGFTVFATALAAWMARCLDREQVSIGVPFRMRSDEAAKETNGLFVELFPLHLTVDPTDTFEELALKVKAGLTRMAAHALPGASAGVPRSAFDVVLNYLPGMEVDFGGQKTVAEWVHTGFIDPAHIVRLHVHPFGAGTNLQVDADLSTDVFGDLEAGWFRTHLTTLLDAATRDPGMEIGSPDLTTWDEVGSYVPASVRVRRPASVLEIFDAQVAARPAAAAVEDAEGSLSYEQLDGKSRRIAQKLVESGVERGALVGISLPRSADLVVAVLGVLRAGAAFVPLDPGAPLLRNRWILEDSGVGIVLSDGPSAPGTQGQGTSPPGDPARWYSLSELEGRADEEVPAVDPIAAGDPRPVSPEETAYVLYTSGSTGRPKGVEVTHGGLADYVTWAVETYAEEGPVRLPFFTSPAFDLTLTSVLVPLASGGTVVVFGQDPDEPAATTVQRIFTEGRVDVVKLTPLTSFPSPALHSRGIEGEDADPGGRRTSPLPCRPNPAPPGSRGGALQRVRAHRGHGGVYDPPLRPRGGPGPLGTDRPGRSQCHDPNHGRSLEAGSPGRRR